MSNYKIEAGTGQHLGDRAEQQDRIDLFSAPLAPGYMMAVLADGMGGAGGGGLAAEQAVRTTKQIFSTFSPLTDDVGSTLQAIFDEVHTVIKLMTLSSDLRPQSTLLILVLTPQHEAIWAHVGDSRLYRFRGPNLAERTTDHTSGVLTANARSLTTPGTEPNTSVLLNALGNSRLSPTPTFGQAADLQAGDAFLLCSDGLWAHCSDGELGPAIAMNTPREASQLLIRKVGERALNGDADNCSLAVIKLVASVKEVPTYQVKKMRRAV